MLQLRIIHISFSKKKNSTTTVSGQFLTKFLFSPLLTMSKFKTGKLKTASYFSLTKNVLGQIQKGVKPLTTLSDEDALHKILIPHCKRIVSLKSELYDIKYFLTYIL